jgi:hypothetical protein
MATYPRCSECDADLMQDREIESGLCNQCNPPPVLVFKGTMELDEDVLADRRFCGATEAAIVHEFIDPMPKHDQYGNEIKYENCTIIEQERNET